MRTHLNLLPWKCRRSQTVRRRLRQWGVVWAAVAILTGAGCWLSAIERRTVQQAVGQLEQQVAPVETMRAQIASFREKLDRVRRREAVLVLLEDGRPPLALLGMVSRSARQCGGHLRVEQLTVRSSEPAKAPAPVPAKADATAKAPPSVSTAATIKGTAQDNLAVARFVLSLRQTQAFDRVELKSSAGQTGGARGCSYLVECAY
jgi:Tfp pilus assembly protein PilN